MPARRYWEFYFLLLLYSHRHRDLISGNREDTQKTCDTRALEIHAVQEICTTSELCILRLEPVYRLFIDRYGVSKEIRNEVFSSIFSAFVVAIYAFVLLT